MKGKKNLERAIILGLILSTGVYGSAWAEGSINNDYDEQFPSSVTIKGDNNTSAIEITDKIVKITTTNKSDGNITLDSCKYGIHLNGDSTVILNAAQDNKIIVTLSSDNADGINAVNGAGGNITFTARENNTIAATGNGTDGIYTDSNNKTQITFTAINGSNEITAGNNGIDHRGDNNITLIADNGGNIIDAGNAYKKAEGDGVRIEGNGKVKLDGKYNSITASDTGLYIHKDSSDNADDNADIELIAQGTDEDNNGYGNYIESIYGSGVQNDDEKGKITVQADNGSNYIKGKVNAVYNNGSGNITIQAGQIDEDGVSTLADYEGVDNILTAGESGVRSDGTGTTNVIAANDNIIAGTTNGILSNDAGTIKVTAGNDNIIGQYTYTDEYEENHTVTSQTGINVTGDNGTINITSTNGKTDIYGKNGISVDGEGNKIYVTAGTNITIDSSNRGIYVYNSNNINNPKNIIELNSENGSNEVVVNAKKGLGIYAAYNSEITLTAKNNEVTLNGNGSAIQSTGSGSKISLNASEVNTIQANGELRTGSWGVYADNDGQVYLVARFNKISGAEAGILSQNLYNGIDSYVEVKATGNNKISSEQVAVHARNAGLVKIQAEDSNIINSEIYGLVSDVHDFGVNKEVAGEINLSANLNNIIKAGVISSNIEEDNFADGLAIVSENGGIINVEAGNENAVFGAVYAGGKAETKVSEVTLSGGKNEDGTLKGSINNVYSAAVITGAGDLDQDETGEMKDAKVISALYAEEGASINVTGENYIRTYAVSDDPDLERVVWAYKDADINIDGATIIKTDNYEKATNSKDIAIAAGTAVNLDYDTVIKPVDLEDRATVNINYENYSNGFTSYISGDILSAYEGLININAKEGSNAGINITGNLLAGNNGILNVDLGKGGVLLGRADDYGDAGVVNNGQAGEGNEHQEFFDPAFSSTIHKGGRVDLGMGAGSTWFVTGQSWITTIDTTKAKGDAENERAKVDLVTEYKDKDGSDIAAHALTVYEFKGDADFLMSLSGNRADTDMLYMKHADGNYRIMLDKDITTSDINQDYATGENYSGLRFATVGVDSYVTFTVGSYDNGGAFNVEYEVGQDVYGSDETAHENEAYNGSKLDGGKPGDDMVDNFFGNNGAPVSDETGNEGAISTASANSIMLMSEEPETLAEETQANDTNAYNAINHKIIAVKGTELNDTGKTILNMSRANYSNAIYMDRLNKRLGEARYINSEEDEGMWVRIRHDRIGKDAAYRSQNTMYELGYDQKQECDNGERRVGMAIDYMHGDTGYDQIAGKGEIDRYGLWLYDTWMGDKGHYADYVAKWGHLSNDFEVYTMNDKTKQVTGDYSNNVFSVSAEYGRKKDIGNDWYFEPQVQAQLARVTGADYTTNQGTKVSVDGINSLIGRAGFRLGKDFGEEKKSTVYIKADVLHEFLGDQDVRVLDKSSDNKWAGISYENEGTWYDVGFGFATQMSKNSYAFMDFEKSFGNDNDETYQINVGMQWSF